MRPGQAVEDFVAAQPGHVWRTVPLQAGEQRLAWKAGVDAHQRHLAERRFGPLPISVRQSLQTLEDPKELERLTTDFSKPALWKSSD